MLIKQLKLVLLILVSVIVMSSVISCSSNKLTVKVIFTNYTDTGEEVLLETEIKINTSDEPPTVLQVAEQALIENEIPYSLSEDKTALTGVFDYVEYEEQTSEFSYTGYEWHLTINEHNEAAGLASVTTLEGGDVIRYTWTSYNKIS